MFTHFLTHHMLDTPMIIVPFKLFHGCLTVHDITLVTATLVIYFGIIYYSRGSDGGVLEHR